MKQKLRVIVLGAGGIGCYYGVRLLSSGHEVTFVARGEHLNAIIKNGLRLTHPNCDFSDSVTAIDFDQLIRTEKPENFDLIFLTTKATSTQNIANELGRWFSETKQSVAVMSLQNGVENEQILCEYIDKKQVFGGLAIKIGGHITEPGIVEAKGVAEIKMGVWPNELEFGTQHKAKLESWSKAMNDAQIPTEIVKDIRHEQWAKLAINHGVNPLSVLTGLDTKKLSHDPLLGSIVHHLMQETAIVAEVDGVNLTDEDINRMYQVIRDFEAIKTSMLVDWEKGQKLEVDAIPGVIINRARKGNIEVPYTQTIFALLQQKISERSHTP